MWWIALISTFCFMFLELFRELVVMCKDETCAEIGLISIAINLHKLSPTSQPQCRQGQTLPTKPTHFPHVFSNLSRYDWDIQRNSCHVSYFCTTIHNISGNNFGSTVIYRSFNLISKTYKQSFVNIEGIKRQRAWGPSERERASLCSLILECCYMIKACAWY